MAAPPDHPSSNPKRRHACADACGDAAERAVGDAAERAVGDDGWTPSGETPTGRGRLSTGDLARGCETTVRTIRFYEEAGLLEPATRTEGGHRVYDPAQLERLRLIVDLREAGLSLSDVRDLFTLRDRGTTAPEASAQLTRTLQSHLECLERKVALLRRLRDELGEAVEGLEACRTCDAPAFRARCAGCEVLQRPSVPRAVRILWGDGR